MNIPLLMRLRGSSGFLAPDSLGPAGAEVERDLDELERFGFQIERHPYHGVAYRGPAARLCPDLIEYRLNTRHVGRRIAVWDRVASTNDIAARAAHSTANNGLVILAEHQSRGRGRRGRVWSAPYASSILLSTLLFPPPLVDDVTWLTALGAVAAAETVEAACGRSARLKWPNDILVEGKKIAGVLVERRNAVVLGLGLNVNARAADFPEELRSRITTLSELTGHTHDRSELARILIQAIDRYYGAVLGDSLDVLNRAWSSRLEFLPRAIQIRTTRGTLEGTLRAACLQQGLELEHNGAQFRVPLKEVLGFEGDEAELPQV